jgi:hypothetical protein
MKISLASLLLAPAVFASVAFAGDDKPAPADGTSKAAKSFTENILKGDYLETRTCDIWTGPCFANSETSEAGREATLAWHFTSGKWAGVDLDGVSAVLVIEAKSTLGDKYHSPLPVRDVLLLDEKATDAQLEAMRNFVKTQLGDLAGNVVEEMLVPIEMKVGCCEKKGCAKLVAGEIVRITTRCLGEKDDICGHEETFYPPLVALKDSLPAFTIESGVKGTLLAHEWTDRDSRSAFLGHFEVRSLAPALAVDTEGIRAK